MDETKIIYHIDDEETPYLVKIPKAPEKVTLGDFKNVLNRPNYKFFFKSMDDDFGVVKEEIVDDDAPLPAFNQRVVSWIVSADTSVADSLSQCGEDGALRHQAYHSSGGESGGGGGPGGGGTGVLDDTTCTETESIISSRRGGQERITLNNTNRGHMRPPRLPRFDKTQDRQFLDRGRVNGVGGRGYESSSMISSDLETTSFFDSDDDASSRITATTTGSSSVSQLQARNRRKKRRHHHGGGGAGGLGGGGGHRHPHHHMHHHQALSHASSISSITDSTMSLNIITVTLNMDSVNFLGISIVGQSCKGGDGGIYVGSIMKGGAVALDGRIEPGDMILQVNDVNFENMSNDGAVRVLRDVVQKPGPIKLVVAKCWDPHPPKGYFTVPRTEPVHPIDPGAWVAHTQACCAMTVDEYPGRPPSASTLTSNTSSIASSVAETERPYEEMKLTLSSPLTSIVRAMAASDSGLEIRDRMWLKITIPNAFIGNEVVDWLYQRVEGFSDRKEARKYASQLLKAGLIKHTVNKREFSEQCYYVFGDICDNLAGLKLRGEGDSLSDLGPLPPPSATSPWGSNLGSVATHLPYQPGGGYATPGASTIAVGGYMQPHSQMQPAFNYTNESYMFNRDSGSGGSSSGTQKKANHRKSPLQSGDSESDVASQITAPGLVAAPLLPSSAHLHQQPYQQQPPSLLLQQQHQPLPPPPLPHQPLPPLPNNCPGAPPMQQQQQFVHASSSSPLVPASNGSCGSGAAGVGSGSSGSERSNGRPGAGPAGQNPDLVASTASFNIAMANPCNYFVDSV